MSLYPPTLNFAAILRAPSADGSRRKQKINPGFCGSRLPAPRTFPNGIKHHFPGNPFEKLTIKKQFKTPAKK
jgi:hypothetical protein